MLVGGAAFKDCGTLASWEGMQGLLLHCCAKIAVPTAVFVLHDKAYIANLAVSAALFRAV